MELQWASAHPERVETLTLQNGNAYAEDIDNDTGHFALEEDLEVIGGHIRSFLAKHVNR